jgi:Membrane transport protein
MTCLLVQHRKVAFNIFPILCECANEFFYENAGTIAQLFEVGEEECSVIFFWTYLIAAIALTVWSMVFMSILF